MKVTQHAQKRMSQRGITKAMVELVLEFGDIDQDKAYLDRNKTIQLVNDLDAKLKIARKILDKGGCVVIESGDAVVTTYNYSTKH